MKQRFAAWNSGHWWLIHGVVVCPLVVTIIILVVALIDSGAIQAAIIVPLVLAWLAFGAWSVRRD